MKSYVSPIVSFESFELSSSGASSCGVRIDTFSNRDCGLDQPGIGVIFVTGIAGCKKPVNDDGESGYCYHVPIDASKLFNS